MRNQTYRGAKYDRFMATVGRAPVEDKALMEAEAEHDKRAIYFQEVTVDGLRHSDWLCTLGTLRKLELVPVVLLDFAITRTRDGRLAKPLLVG